MFSNYLCDNSFRDRVYGEVYSAISNTVQVSGLLMGIRERDLFVVQSLMQLGVGGSRSGRASVRSRS